MKYTLKVLVVGLAFVFMSIVVNGATFTVNTTNDTLDATPGDGICADASAQCSVRAAISEANAFAGDDTITIPAGTYTQTLVAANEDLNAGGDWDIRSNITINGAGAATTILQAAATPGTATERVMENVLAANVTIINGVTLRHGNKTGAAANATRGGGIRNVGTLTMNDSVVTLNTASGSGGIRNERTITLNNVTVSNNACNVAGNCFGGGMYSTLAALSTVTINNSTFSNNTATATAANTFGFAAGMGIESATGFNLVITGSTFTNNIGTGTGTGGSNGNGIRVLATVASTANITNSSFNNNSGTGGSAIQGSGIQAFTSGTGTLSGTWDGITVNGNSAVTGAGVALVPTGGAMNITIQKSTISNNTASGPGGGAIISNSGATSGASSSISFVNSTVSGNTANGAGGGLFVEQPAATGSITTNFNYVTIANNRANNDNSGADSGGGIFRSTAGGVNLKNTIVGDNSVGTGGSGPDIFGTVTSQDYNHIEDLTGATVSGTTTNNSTGDAQLGALANNGGPTQTHLPATGSVVVNAIPSGTSDCGASITTDQRGTVRPTSGACEKGSVELAVAAAPVYVSGQVLSTAGPLKGVWVTISGGNLSEPISVQTNTFGYYRFNNLTAGQTYTLEVNNKKYTFTPSTRQITPNANVDNENFTADPF